MKIVAIIQARMGSSRLPGKVLKEIEGIPLLTIQLERLKASKWLHTIVVATTTEEKDDEIVEFCKRYGILYYRGSETDVLARYYGAAVEFQADCIVRLTSDCPIIDPLVVDKTIKYFIESGNYDYASNTLERTYPRGLDTEIFTFEILEKAFQGAASEIEREHVTTYFYMNPQLFKLGSIKNNIDYSYHRWTVDTEEDFELISLIMRELYLEKPLFTLEDTINLLEKNPDWVKINEHIEQKKL